MPHFENDTFHVQGTAKDVYKRQTCYVRRLSLVVVERILIGRSLSLSHTDSLSLSLSLSLMSIGTTKLICVARMPSALSPFCSTLESW